MSVADFWVGPFSAPDTYGLFMLLGGGGEGEVWKAELPLSTAGRSTVALKILPVRPGDHQEWEQTARLLRMLNHPGLVRVTDVFTGPSMHRSGQADTSTEARYVVMDCIEGRNLREWCDENPDAPPSARLSMLRTVASALDDMHSGAKTQVPVAHGDVKPANIVVRDGGGTVLVDLGLTRLTDGGGLSGRSAPYAAPELRRPGAMATPSADSYAFAVTTAQVLLGQPLPVGADGWLDERALEAALHTSPITARRPSLIRHTLTALAAPPEARPRQLRLWLDAATESLSQVTDGGGAQPMGAYVGTGMTVTEPTGPFGRSLATGAHPDQTTQAGPPITGRLSTGAAPGAPAPRIPPRQRPVARRWWPLILAAASMTAVIVAAILLLPGGDGDDDQLGGAASGTPPTTGSPTLTTTPSPTAEASAQETPSAEASKGGTSRTPVPTTSRSGATGLPTTSIYLTDLDVVERDGAGRTDFDEVNVSGERYSHAVTLSAYCYNQDGGDYWIDYDLGRSWSTFTATVGLRDDSRSATTATYTVMADNVPVATGNLVLGDAVPLAIDVTDVLRLRLKMNAPLISNTSCYEEKLYVSWGDPTLHPAN